MYNSDNTTTDPQVPSTTQAIVLDNINLQKWVNITMTINTRTIDIYMNGNVS